MSYGWNTSSKSPEPGLTLSAVLLVALALSIGWGVRGQWGHEIGAMVPGVLASVAACLVSGRKDWRRRVVYFAFFGAWAWSLGGQMSYGLVIGYTHSGQLASVAFGFASLFLIGFLWGAVGGAGTSYVAVAERRDLAGMFVPIGLTTLFWGIFWLLGGLAEQPRDELARWFAPALVDVLKSLRAERLNWLDSDWIAVLLALAAAGAVALFRRGLDRSTRLIVSLAVGWWLGFTVLAVGLGLRMTPPRSDNWAGMLGLVVALLVFLARERLHQVAWAAVLIGFFTGLGFVLGNMLQLVGIATGVSANWHSLLEQTMGFSAGLGVALAMGYLATVVPRLSDDPPVGRWTEPVALVFVLLGVTFLNIYQNIDSVWLPNALVPKAIAGVTIQGWFTLGYAALGLVLVALAIARRRGRRIAAIPTDWLGKGQILFVVFLWWIVLGNLSRLPHGPQRIVTEGLIHLNACLATLLALITPREEQVSEPRLLNDFSELLRTTAITLLVVAAVIVGVETLVTRAIYGDQAVVERFPERGGQKITRFGLTP